MGGKKLLQRLLRMKGFRITWFELHERKREILIGVKPHKMGCRCSHCDRRCEIVTILPEWRDVVLCGTIERLREGHRIRGLRSVGVDEISYCKGRKFATIVYDLDRHCVVWVGKGKGRETIDLFFRQELSPKQRSAITRASCDMSQAYIGALKDHCPNAVLVLDHFHITKALLAAVDEVRKEEWRKAEKSSKVTFKGLRWLLFLHSSNN